MRTFIVVLSVLLAITLTASMVNASIDWSERLVYLWYAATATPADLDDDGDLDIWAIGYMDVAWYENNGYQAFSQHMVSDVWNYGIGGTVADIDGDGDLDGVGCAWSGDEVAWFDNDGSGNFTYTPISFVDGAYGVDAEDMDQDDDMDLVVGGDYSHAIYWFENDGSANFTQHTVDTVSFPRYVQAIDMDQDGDWDVIGAVVWGDYVAWFENDGSMNFTRDTIGTIEGPYDCIGVDFDLDGDNDVVCCTFWGDLITWFENDGSQNFTEHPIAIALDGAKSIDVADFDNDGDLDVVGCATLLDYVCWFENDGSMNFLQHTLPNYLDYPGGLKAVDMEQDGDMDFIACPNEDRLLWFENTLLSPYPITMTLTPDTLPVQVPAGGGSFDFALDLENTGTESYSVDAWLDITLPDGTIYPILNREGITLGPLASISRDLTQFVPGTAMPGNYSYNGHVRDVATWAIMTEDSFPFEKLEGIDEANHNLGWTLFGWEDPEDVLASVPIEYELYPAYPNPFNPTTTLRFALPEAGQISLIVFDSQGRQVATLVDRWCDAGIHEVTFSGEQLSSGIYFARLLADNYEQTQKLLLAK